VFKNDIIEHLRRSVNNEGEIGQSSVVGDKGLSDVEEYNSDELESGSDSDEDGVENPKLPTFKMPYSMKKFKWEVGTLFMTKSDFQDVVRTYAVENAKDLKFKKNDMRRMMVICKGDLENLKAIICPHFQRMYVCFKGCRDSFFKCRPIIGLDGCFLKTPYGGMLLAAIGMDPNDQILPIAYDVVEGETKESWIWFLELLIADLGGTRLFFNMFKNLVINCIC